MGLGAAAAPLCETVAMSQSRKRALGCEGDGQDSGKVSSAVRNSELWERSSVPYSMCIHISMVLGVRNAKLCVYTWTYTEHIHNYSHSFCSLKVSTVCILPMKIYRLSSIHSLHVVQVIRVQMN